MTLVVLGDLMVDVVARIADPLAHASDTPARISVQGGGSAANTAAWAASIGTDVALVCRVGDDDRAGDLRGVDVHAAVDSERPTGTCIVLVEPGGERTMLPDPGANDGPCPRSRSAITCTSWATRCCETARAPARWRQSSVRGRLG